MAQTSCEMWSTRWWYQVYALWEKNVQVMKGNTMKVLSCLVIPSLVVFVLFVGNNEYTTNNSSITNEIPSPLQGLGDCDAFFSDRCLQIAYTPNNSWANEVMRNVAALNNIDNTDDRIQGFETSSELQVGNFM